MVDSDFLQETQLLPEIYLPGGVLLFAYDLLILYFSDENPYKPCSYQQQ